MRTGTTVTDHRARACVSRVARVCVVDSTDARVDVFNVRKVAAERRECAWILVTPTRHRVRIGRTYGHARVERMRRRSATQVRAQVRNTIVSPLELGYRTDPDWCCATVRNVRVQVCAVIAAREVTREFARTS